MVQQGRIVAFAVLSEEAPSCTSPELIARVLGRFPGVTHHACVNAHGPVFSACMEHTSLPHLLEHVVVELQAQHVQRFVQERGVLPAGVREDFAFVGATEWVGQGRRRARISVNFTDDIVALRAFSEAIEYLNGLLLS